MRKITSILMIALLAIVGVGCDSSSDNDTSDTERFVGTWALTGVTDASGNRTADFAAGFSSVVLTNAAAGTFSMVVNSNDNPATTDVDESQFPLTATGTYVVRESTNEFTLNLISPAEAALGFTYTFPNEDSANLTANSVGTFLLNTLFGTTLVAPAVITVTRVG